MNAPLFLLLSLLPLASLAAEQSGSLLGKPVNSLVGSLDQYSIEPAQSKAAPVFTFDQVRYVIEHSQLIDPTLPEVRENPPLIAVVRLRHRERTNEVVRIDLCAGLGLLHGTGPVTYAFRYRFPWGAPPVAGRSGPAPGNDGKQPRIAEPDYHLVQSQIADEVPLHGPVDRATVYVLVCSDQRLYVFRAFHSQPMEEIIKHLPRGSVLYYDGNALMAPPSQAQMEALMAFCKSKGIRFIASPTS